MESLKERLQKSIEKVFGNPNENLKSATNDLSHSLNNTMTMMPTHPHMNSTIRNNTSFTGFDTAYDLTDNEELRNRGKAKRDAKRTAK